MTDVPASDEPLAQPQPTPTLIFSIGAIFVVTLVVAMMFGASASEQLLFGWLYFPLRVVDDVTVGVRRAAAVVVERDTPDDQREAVLEAVQIKTVADASGVCHGAAC